MARPPVNAIHPFRRAFFLAAVLLVLVGLPLVYAYTNGIRFSRTSARLVPTGALVVETVPSGATVTVNGRPAPDRTPLRAPSLTPGRYRIELAKEGYAPWSKTLTVEAGRATLALSVQLLRTHPVVEVLAPPADQLSLNPTGSTLLERRGGTWSLRRLPQNSAEPLGPGSEWAQVRWSTDGRRALVWTEAGVTLLRIGVPTRRIEVPQAKDAGFDPLDSDGVLLAGERGIDRWSPTAHVRQPLLDRAALAVRAVGTRIAWQTAPGDLWSAQRTISGGIGTPIAALPGTHFGPETGDGTLLTLDAASTYRIAGGDPERAQTIATVATRATEAGGALALASEASVWAGVGPLELLYRSRDPIAANAWLPGSSVLAIQVGDVILGVELDGRDHRNVTELYRGPGCRLLGREASGRLIIAQPENDAGGPVGILAVRTT